MEERYKLYNGDCLEVMDRLIEQNIKVNMILCDLPYGTTARNSWDTIIPFDELWGKYSKITHDNSAIVLFGSQPFSTKLASSNIDDFKYEWIWIKDNTTGFQNANRMPMKNHENILVFYKKQPVYNPQGIIEHGKVKVRHTVGTNFNDIKDGHIQRYTNYPKQILNFSIDRGKNRFHPTQKPVLLLEYLIKTYTNENMLVLDNTMGSGSTGVACMNTNRKFIGIELDNTYFNIAKDRIEKAERELDS